MCTYSYTIHYTQYTLCTQAKLQQNNSKNMKFTIPFKHIFRADIWIALPTTNKPCQQLSTSSQCAGILWIPCIQSYNCTIMRALSFYHKSSTFFCFLHLARRQEIIKMTEQLIEAINNGDFETYT